MCLIRLSKGVFLIEVSNYFLHQTTLILHVLHIYACIFNKIYPNSLALYITVKNSQRTIECREVICTGFMKLVFSVGQTNHIKHHFPYKCKHKFPLFFSGWKVSR